MAKESFFKKIFSSKSLSYLLFLLLFFVIVSLGREINRQASFRKELGRLQKETSSLESENEKLFKELEKIKTDYFKEQAARTKLGLQKPGEKIIVIVPPDGGDGKEIKTNYFYEKVSNFKSWWQKFFSPKEKE